MDGIFLFFFFFFVSPRKIVFGISYRLLPEEEIIFMKYQRQFSGTNKKKVLQNVIS